jgi:hypothetical protein
MARLCHRHLLTLRAAGLNLPQRHIDRLCTFKDTDSSVGTAHMMRAVGPTNRVSIPRRASNVSLLKGPDRLKGQFRLPQTCTVRPSLAQSGRAKQLASHLCMLPAEPYSQPIRLPDVALNLQHAHHSALRFYSSNIRGMLQKCLMLQHIRTKLAK